MKKLYCLLVMVLALLASSCTGDAAVKRMNTQLLKHVPTNVDYVVVGDLTTVVKSADGEFKNGKLVLPSYITDYLSSCIDRDDYKVFEKALEKFNEAGINPSAAIFGNYDDDEPVILFSIKDKKSFYNFLDDMKFRENDKTDGWVSYLQKVYYSEWSNETHYYVVVTNGSYAYLTECWVEKKSEAVDVVMSVIKKVKRDNFAKTGYGKYIQNSNVAGAALRIPGEIKVGMKGAGVPGDIANIFDGAVCMRSNLNKNKLEAKLTILDKNGKEANPKPLKDYVDISAQINKNALALLGEDEFMVFGGTAKDVKWNKLLDDISLNRSDRHALNMAMDYIENLNGTVIMGCGVKNGLKTLGALDKYKYDDALKQVSFTYIIEMKKGKAAGMVDDLQDLAKKFSAGTIKSNDNGFQIEIDNYRYGDMTFYVGSVDNFFVVATHPIEKKNNNPVAKEFQFDKFHGACGLVLYSDNKIMKDLCFDNTLKLSMTQKPKSFELTFTFEVDGGTRKGLVGKLAESFINFASKYKNPDDLEEHFEELLYGNDNKNSYYPDNYMDLFDEDDDYVSIESAYETAEEVDAPYWDYDDDDYDW